MATPCVFSVTAGTFSSTAVYTWHIDYQYGGTASHDFTGSAQQSPTKQRLHVWTADARRYVRAIELRLLGQG